MEGACPVFFFFDWRTPSPNLYFFVLLGTGPVLEKDYLFFSMVGLELLTVEPSVCRMGFFTSCPSGSWL